MDYGVTLVLNLFPPLSLFYQVSSSINPTPYDNASLIAVALKVMQLKMRLYERAKSPNLFVRKQDSIFINMTKL